MRLWLLSLAVVGAALAAALIIEVVDSAGPALVSRPPLAAPSPVVPAQTPRIRIAVAPVVSPRSSLFRYERLVHELADRLQMKGELLLRESYAEVEALLRTGNTDLAFVCTWSYVQGQSDYGLELLAIPVIKGQRDYRSLLLVPRSPGAASTLEELRGKRFAAADPLSNTGWLYPADQLRERGHDPDAFFSEVVFTGGHDRSVLAVADGLVEGAAVDSVVFEEVTAAEPRLLTRVQVIHRSQAFGMPPVVVPPGMAPDLRARVRDALLSLHATQEGRAALEPLGIDRFELAQSAAYDGVRAMAARDRTARQR